MKVVMGNKARAKAQQIKGKYKESIGEDAGRKKLARKGRTDQRKGSLKQAGQKLKEAITRR